MTDTPESTSERIAAMAYLAVVYGLRANMVHNFDMTVRRLAGVA